ncbi:MAG: TRAP transporter substrate-binding protein DctP [Chloroflexota bacterium]
MVKRTWLVTISVLTVAILLALMMGACSSPAPAPAPSPTPSPAPAPAAKTWELKVVDNSGNPANEEFQQFWDWTRRVTVATGGRVTWKYLGGPEVYPLNEVTQALIDGLFDAFPGVATYYSGIIPAVLVQPLTGYGAAGLRKSGFNDIMDAALNEHGLHYLFNQRTSPDYLGNSGIFTNKPVNSSADLKGMKLRAKAPEDAVMKAFGATTVMVQADEIYTAVERGLVDGTVYPSSQTFYARSLNEVLKYWNGPTFFKNSTLSAMNLKTWQSFPADIQQIMNEQAAAAEETWAPLWESILSFDQIRLQRDLQRILWTPEDSQQFYTKGYQAAWESYTQKNPVYGPKFKAVAGDNEYLPPISAQVQIK